MPVLGTKLHVPAMRRRLVPRPRLTGRLQGDPWMLDDGMQAFRLRLTPPFATLPDAVEVVVTGPTRSSAA